MVDAMSYEGVQRVVKNHPSFFSEIYQERYINNIYLDTPTLRYYYANQVGTAQREKMRIRWYGDLEGLIQRPILEIKKKNGMTGTKRSFPLSSFSMDTQLDQKNLDRIFASTELPEDVREMLHQVRPALVNRYRRKYFLEFSKNFRVTLDREMSYYPTLNQSIMPPSMVEERGTVVELKYDAPLDDEASRISNGFPFRMTKNSKYVKGIEMFYPVAL